MGTEYNVLKIDEMTRNVAGDGLVHIYRHTIKTKGGVVLTVDIPEKDFTVEKTAPILQKKAIEADKILAL